MLAIIATSAANEIANIARDRRSAAFDLERNLRREDRSRTRGSQQLLSNWLPRKLRVQSLHPFPSIRPSDAGCDNCRRMVKTADRWRAALVSCRGVSCGPESWSCLIGTRSAGTRCQPAKLRPAHGEPVTFARDSSLCRPSFSGFRRRARWSCCRCRWSLCWWR